MTYTQATERVFVGFDAIAKEYQLQTRGLKLKLLPKELGLGLHTQETEARECRTIMMGRVSLSLVRTLQSDGPHWQARIPLPNSEQQAIASR